MDTTCLLPLPFSRFGIPEQSGFPVTRLVLGSLCLLMRLRAEFGLTHVCSPIWYGLVFSGLFIETVKDKGLSHQQPHFPH
jgi:hypothetical protein